MDQRTKDPHAPPPHAPSPDAPTHGAAGDGAPAGAPPMAGPVALFVQVTQSLMDLISRETQLLESRRPSEVQPLQGEKARLTAEYQKLLNVLKAHESALLGPKDSAVRRHLRQVMETFRRVVAYHARLVGRLKSVCEGVVNAISEEANRQRRDSVPHYGRDARMAYGRAGSVRSLSLDSEA
ncbi:hypothetical protein CCR85_05300 [Rhodothalassium salexigens]|uniref:hypothetical protein n=1 Tax=Rhodothalassium salexigens TaxID=1086 RepID=UPI001912A290|nr:hypothetical protein [Rhodothalassium salexigens]MBK5910909.1 hypothetical protein [Rhodothalassium salexigens]